MATEHTLTAKGGQRPDGRMTIAELREFLAQIEQTADNNGTVPKVRIAFGGAIKSISVTIPANGQRSDR